MPGVRVLRVAAAVMALAMLTSCSNREQETDPTPTPTVSEPTFEIHPVVGERAAAVFHLSSREILGNGAREPLDEAGANQVIEEIARWLDGHLDDLQRGGEGDLVSVAPAGLVVAAEQDAELPAETAAQIAAVTTDLTNPDNPVAAARYHLTVYGEDVLEWASAQVEVTRADKSVAGATFTFTIGENYGLSLVLAGPEEGADA